MSDECELDFHGRVDDEAVAHWVAYQCHRRLPDGEWQAGKPLGASDDICEAMRLCSVHARQDWGVPLLAFGIGGGARGLVSYEARLPVQSERVARTVPMAARWPREALYDRQVSVEILYVVEGF